MKYCTEYAALLDLFVDGELDAAEMERVQTHLENCPGCRAYVDDVLLIRAAFPDAEGVEVPEGFAEGVMERIRAESKAEGKPKKSGQRWLRAFVPLAACCALVVLLHNGPGLSGGSAGNSSSVSSDSTADAGADAPADCAAPAGSAVPQAEEDAMEAADEETVCTGGGILEPEAPAARSFAYNGDAEKRDVPAGAPVAPREEPQMEATYDNIERKAPALTMAAEDAGDLLTSWTLMEEQGNVRRYVLTEEQYEELLAELATKYGANAATSRAEAADDQIFVEVTGPF